MIHFLKILKFDLCWHFLRHFSEICHKKIFVTNYHGKKMCSKWKKCAKNAKKNVQKCAKSQKSGKCAKKCKKNVKKMCSTFFP